MKGRICRLMKEEEGGIILIMAPYLVGIMFLFLVLYVNGMTFAMKRNQAQIMADSASRAGALAVGKTYAIRERKGHGYGDYHVYTELEASRAKELANRVLASYEPLLKGVEVTRIEENPSEGYTFPVWNSRRFRYEEQPLSYEKQFKNGNYSLKINVKIDAVTKGFFSGVMDSAEAEVYSQSTARGRLTGIH